MFSHLLGIYLKAIAGSNGNSIFTFLGTVRLLSEEAVIFILPPAVINVLISLHPCQHLLSNFLILTILLGEQWCLVVLIGISSMTNDVDGFLTNGLHDQKSCQTTGTQFFSNFRGSYPMKTPGSIPK